MGSWSDLCSHQDQAELGAKLDSKNSGHPRAVEQAEECLGACSPFVRPGGRRGGSFSPAAKVHSARMAERFGGAVKSRDELVLL